MFAPEAPEIVAASTTPPSSGTVGVDPELLTVAVGRAGVGGVAPLAVDSTGGAVARGSSVAAGVARELPPPSPPPPRETTTAMAPPISKVPTRPTDHQDRPLGRGVVLAPATLEMVDGSGRCVCPSVTAARGGSSPTMPLARCTETTASASDCAYFASACASSAVFWNRLAGSFSRQR